MLDINLFRDESGGKSELVRESQRRRHNDVGLVDLVIAKDKEWKEARFKADSINRDLNNASKGVGVAIRQKKPKEEIDQLKQKSIDLKADKEAAAVAMSEIEKARDTALLKIGNLVPDSVPNFKSEDHNKIEDTWGQCGPPPGRGLIHVDLLYMLDGVEYDRGASVAGSRGYFLKGPGALLNQALIQYATKFICQRGFTPVQTPLFMEREAMAKCAQLEQFDEELYKVTGESGSQEKYLIATSEQPLCAYFANDWVDPKTLPIKFAGLSTCFRKEAGSHGRDTLGIFRVHQFDKIEQFVVTSPEDNASWIMQEEMIENAKEFYQSLEIPYQVVNIVSGALNNAAAKKYDLEGWYPASKAYRELVSCSNCTDYQSRRLETRFGNAKQGNREKKYTHMLNSTLCATTRVLCAILENNQTDSGVRVPEVLQPIVGTDFYSFTREAPVRN